MSTAPPDQQLMGYAIAAVCFAGVVYSRWFLNNTNKGRWLLIRFGPKNGSGNATRTVHRGDRVRRVPGSEHHPPIVWELRVTVPYFFNNSSPMA